MSGVHVREIRPGDRIVCPIDGDVDEITAVASLTEWVSLSTPRHLHRFRPHALVQIATVTS